VGCELAAEASADVVHMDFDLRGGQLQALGHVAANAGDVLSRGPEHDRVPAPLYDLSMRLEAAVSDDRDPVLAFVYDFGVLEALIGIAGDLPAGGLGAGSGFGQILFAHQVRHHFVLHFDLAAGIVGDLFGGGRHRRDLGAGPLDLRAGPGDHADGGDASDLLRLVGI